MPITTTPTTSTLSISEVEIGTLGKIVDDLTLLGKTEDDLVRRTMLVSMALWIEMFHKRIKENADTTERN